MFVWRWNNCRSPTIGEKYVSPLPLSSGLNSSLALSCGLLVIAPNSAHVVSLSAFTVRSGSALPSEHQNFQPMSQGTYSASNFIRSRTIRAASMTSLPTPSPGIHAILYLAIERRLYRGSCYPQAAFDFLESRIAGKASAAACASPRVSASANRISGCVIGGSPTYIEVCGRKLRPLQRVAL